MPEMWACPYCKIQNEISNNQAKQIACLFQNLTSANTEIERLRNIIASVGLPIHT